MNNLYKGLLEDAIKDLPLKDRVIIRLHLAGETETDIGRATQMSQQHASRRIRKITTELASKCQNADGAF